MPDRYGNTGDDRLDEFPAPPVDDELDPHAAAEARAAAIAACNLCDSDGYRPGGGVCNHNPDQDAINARGIAMVRQALAKEHP